MHDIGFVYLFILFFKLKQFFCLFFLNDGVFKEISLVTLQNIPFCRIVELFLGGILFIGSVRFLLTLKIISKDMFSFSLKFF